MTVWGCMRLVCNYVCNDVEGWVSEEYVLGYHSSEFYTRRNSCIMHIFWRFFHLCIYGPFLKGYRIDNCRDLNKRVRYVKLKAK